MKTIERSPFDEAMLDAALEDFSDIPEDEDDIDLELSPQCLEKAEALVRKTKRRTWHYVNTTAKRILLVAIISVLLASTAMAIPAVRNAVLGFFIVDNGPEFKFIFDAELIAAAPKRLETVYFPTYIPEGYHKVEDFESISRSWVSVAWEDGIHEWEWIIYSQECMPEAPDSSGYNLNADDVETQLLVLGDYEVFYVHHLGEVHTYNWTNGEYFFYLSCPEFMSQEEMQKIFFSIQVDPDAIFDDME
ncbi:MAG: DUF4367 domain-containing protein [Faecousia sp.]